MKKGNQSNPLYETRILRNSNLKIDKGITSLIKTISFLTTSIKTAKTIAEVNDQIFTNLKYFLTTVGNEIANENKILVDDIINSLLCDLCQESIPDSVLDCGHSLCENCIEKVVENSKNTSKLQCAKCQQEIYPINISSQFAKQWYEDHEKNEGVCYTCKAKTFEKRACGHYCDECICNKFRKGHMTCEVCSIKIVMPDELFSLEVQCKACKNDVFLLGDYAKTICGNHVHCYFCLKKVLETRQCQACSEEISEKEEIIIFHFLHSVCSKCGKTHEKIYFIPKQCCEYEICGPCQESFTHCENCGEVLERYSVSAIEKFAASKKLLEIKADLEQ